MHGCVRAYTQRCDVMNFAFACFVIECHFALFYSGMLILLVKMWNKQLIFLFDYQKNHGIK